MMAPTRHGLVILAVLMVVTLSALVGLSIVSSGGAVRAQTDASVRRLEVQAMAWSGVQIVLGELGTQRDALLGSSDAQLTTRTELYQTPAGERAIVQLVVRESEDPFDTSDRAFVPIAGSVNLNAVDLEMLSTVDGFAASDAEAIVSGRAKGAYTSVAEAAARTDLDLSDVIEHLCVSSYDPSLTAGAGQSGGAGTDRINIVEDATALDPILSEILSSSTAASILDTLDATPIQSASDLIDLLIRKDVPQRDWSAVLDRVCFSSEPHAAGRIDVLRAPESVLACIPGLDTNAARSMVSARERLSDDERRGLTWPLTTGSISLEAFREALPWMTNRSLQLRVRVLAGFAPTDQDASLSAAELRDAAYTDRLGSRVEWDVIVDAAEDPPRVSMIRDVTSESAWQLIEAERASLETTQPEPDADPEPSTSAGPHSSERNAPSSSEPEPTSHPSVRVGRWFSAGGSS